MAFYRDTLAWLAAIAALSAISITPGMAAVVPSTAGDDPLPENRALEAVGAILGRFRIEATLNTLYDGNIQRVGDGLPQRPGREKADVRFSPAVTVSTNLPFGRQALFATGTLGRDFYAQNTILNRNQVNANAGINWALGTRCTGVTDIAFSSRQQLFSESAVNDPNLRETLSYGASARCQAGVGIGFGGSVRRIETRNDSITRQDFDVDTTIISPEISYSLPTLGRISIGGSFNQSKYPRRSFLTPDGTIQGDGVEIWSGRVGYARGLGSRLSISAGLSYLRVRPEPTAVLFQEFPLDPLAPLPPLTLTEREENSNLGFDFGLSYNRGARLSATLSASRSATASVNVGAQYQLQQNYALDIDYKLTRGIAMTGGASVRQNDYRNSFIDVGAGEPLRRLRDRISRVYVGANYNPVTLYSVGVELSYQDRNSNPSIYSFGSFAALLKLRVGFGR